MAELHHFGIAHGIVQSGITIDVFLFACEASHENSEPGRYLFVEEAIIAGREDQTCNSREERP